MVDSDSTLELEAYRRNALQGDNVELAAILLVEGQSVSVVHPFVYGEQVLVGRVESSDLVVDDDSVSRCHARFTWNNGQIVVEDLGSRNGTWISGKRISRATLASGDRVTIGNAKLAVVIANAINDVRISSSSDIPHSSDLVIKNPKMIELYQQVRRLASHSGSVLILGETGTGKEHVATALHLWGNRCGKCFKTLNCGAIPKELAESILFGHEKGAFTGANSRNLGLFEQADGGVLFLDEVGELSTESQAALLRAVETKKIIRLGSSKELTVDVRIIAATNRSLEAMVEEGSFRRDLFHRLATIIVELPPLRERRDEIKPLIELFVEQSSRLWNQSVDVIRPEVIDKLENFFWPGNIRQLRNIIESSVLKCTDRTLELRYLPDYIVRNNSPESKQSHEGRGANRRPATLPSIGPVVANGDNSESVPLKDQIAFWESALIADTMKKTAGDRKAASRLLHIPIRTLSRKLQVYGLLDVDWTTTYN